ncbi:LytTR family transcriptional regulator [Pedobacter hiemivivus]|uniref:LytTR family transcriptional regulator n=1 Tax=Pedobacter hiemivivus TaxID=2530454 RepID=A0A4U1G9C0_9SPHI|nr:LytTR family transcriptional regulator [Pedobacter hiemivivus]
MNKLIINSQDTLRFISIPSIKYCKSDNCYTSVFLDNGEELIVCKSLKKLSDEISSQQFIRVSQSFLVNKDHIKLIDKKNKQLKLLDDKQIPFTTSIAELLVLMKIK